MMDLFFDPLIRGPFWASSLLAIFLSLIGCVAFYSKKPLLAEVIAHCSYPGALIGLVCSIILYRIEKPLFIIFVAFIFAILGVFFVKRLLESLFEDSSMTLVLAGFFGFGVLLTSIVQQKFSKFYRLAQGYLFGQVSTMTDVHVWIYLVMLLATASLFILFHSRIKLFIFDTTQSFFSKNHPISWILEILICLGLVLGIRGIGVVLVSSFFVAPAAFSLRFSRNLSTSLIISAVMAFFLNLIAFKMNLNAPLGPVLVLLMSVLSFTTLQRKVYERV